MGSAAVALRQSLPKLSFFVTVQLFEISTEKGHPFQSAELLLFSHDQRAPSLEFKALYGLQSETGKEILHLLGLIPTEP
jgi:hypothetical protein